MPKPPNQELITHEKKRKIEAQLFSMRKKLRESGKDESEVDAQIKSERERLMAEMHSSQNHDLRDKH